MNKPEIDQIVSSLKENFGDSIISYEQLYDFPVIIIDKKSVLNILKFLFDNENYQFRFLTTLCGIHFPDAEKPFAMMYQVHSLVHNIRIRIKSFTSKEDLKFDSVTGLFATANWMEREAYDFYGIQFNNHPNMTRILNVDDMDYFPMRKEYPVEDLTRYDKDDTMFGRERSNFKKLN